MSLPEEPPGARQMTTRACLTPSFRESDDGEVDTTRERLEQSTPLSLSRKHRARPEPTFVTTSRRRDAGTTF
jgi:hypothetical protein